MAWTYDPENVFAKILRGEIPNRTVYEDEHALAFEDLRPQAPVHVLVIPKGAYVSFDHFAAEAGEAEIAGWVRAIGEVTRLAGASVSQEVGGGGFRVISNAGADAVQEVPHLHVHVLGGRGLGRILGEG